MGQTQRQKRKNPEGSPQQEWGVQRGPGGGRERLVHNRLQAGPRRQAQEPPGQSGQGWGGRSGQGDHRRLGGDHGGLG